MDLAGSFTTITVLGESSGGGGSGGGIRITTLSSSKSTVMIGDSGLITFNWAVSGTETSITFNGSALNVGDRSFTIPAPTATTIYTLAVSDGTKSDSKSITVIVANGIIYGTVANPIGTISDVIANPAHTIVPMDAVLGQLVFIITIPPEYLVIAHPASITPSFMMSGFIFDSFTSTSEMWVNPNGYSEQYTVLTSINPYNSSTVTLEGV